MRLKKLTILNYCILAALFCGILITACVTEDDTPRTETLTVSAGSDLTGKIGRTITLNGSGTTDSDGNAIDYDWQVMSRPEGSSASIQNANTQNPEFIPDLAGQYGIKLTASTEFEEAEDEISIVITSALTVDAQGNTEGKRGRPIALDGTATTDSEGDEISYLWSLVSSPEEVSVEIENATEALANFTTDVKGTFVFSLLASTEFEQDEDFAEIIVGSTLNIVAGEDFEAFVGRTVSLDGSATTDEDGSSITYNWEIRDQPEGSNIVLNNNDQAIANFAPELEGNYVFDLTASTEFESKTDDIVISINSSLTIDAGEDVEIKIGNPVQFDGSGTTDSEGESITFEWAIESGPAGSIAEIVDADSATPSIIPDMPGDYIIKLTASTEFETKSDELTVVALPPTEFITDNISAATIWSKQSTIEGVADYRIMNNISISAKLTVEAGVLIELEEGVVVNITENGRLNAIGTSEDRIVFTGVEKTKGYWGELFFLNSISVDNRFEYVTFEYGGGGQSDAGDPFALVYMESQFSTGGTTASFLNCIFRESEGYGLGTSVSNNTDLLDFSNNQFINNNGEAITTGLRIARKIDNATTFEGNGLNGIRLRSNTLTETAEIPGVDYIISGTNMLVEASLKINAGAHFKVEEGLNITVRNAGVLEAIGTVESQIVFEGVQNVKGFWGGILFTNSKSVDNRLSHVTITDGGNRVVDNVRFNLSVGGDFSNDFSEVRIDNCTFNNSSGYGLNTRRVSSSMPSFSNNSFEANEVGAIFLFTAEHVRFIDSESNLGDVNNYVLVNGGTTTTNGTWNTLSGSAYYVINNDVSVESKITVNAGANFRFNENRRMSIRNANSSFTALGTAENQIVFTSNRNDDVILWDGLYFNNSNSVDNKMEHVVVENAGRNDITARHGKANIAVGGGFSNDVSDLDIRNCIIRNSGGMGISVRSDSSINLDAETENTFESITEANVDRTK